MVIESDDKLKIINNEDDIIADLRSLLTLWQPWNSHMDKVMRHLDSLNWSIIWWS